MFEHSADLPLAVLVSVLVIKELSSLVRYAMGRINGRRIDSEVGTIGPGATCSGCPEVLRIRDTLERIFEKLTELGERVARLEPR